MLKINYKKGFTLLELLVVVAIVGIIVAVVMVALDNARNKGGDAGVKANLRNAISQGEIFYFTNTANPNSYKYICGLQSNMNKVGILVLAAAKANGYTYENDFDFDRNVAGSVEHATCNSDDSGGKGWAAEVPLKSAGSNQMWCVDSTGKSLQTNGSTLNASTDVLCGN